MIVSNEYLSTYFCEAAYYYIYTTSTFSAQAYFEFFVKLHFSSKFSLSLSSPVQSILL